MIENAIVALIVGASAWYALGRYLPVKWRKRASGGCGSGCDSCKACATPEPGPQRVIKLHKIS